MRFWNSKTSKTELAYGKSIVIVPFVGSFLVLVDSSLVGIHLFGAWG